MYLRETVQMNEDDREAGLAATPSYRYADVVGNELFVAGQVPHNAAGEIVGGVDAGAQTTQCLENLKLLIATNGFELADIRHMTLYVVGEHQNLIDAWQAMTTWWNGEVPPATLLGLNDLGHTGQLAEIDARIVRA